MEHKIPFSNGSDATAWIENNCELCIKGSRPKGDGTWTKGRCRSDEEIATGFIGNEKFSRKTLERCSFADCPDFVGHYPKRKKKLDDNQLQLF